MVGMKFYKQSAITECVYKNLHSSTIEIPDEIWKYCSHEKVFIEKADAYVYWMSDVEMYIDTYYDSFCVWRKPTLEEAVASKSPGACFQFSKNGDVKLKMNEWHHFWEGSSTEIEVEDTLENIVLAILGQPNVDCFGCGCDDDIDDKYRWDGREYR